MTMRVDVCICTFRRDSLMATLASVAGQRGADLRVIVADNDETPSRRDAIEAEGRRLGIDLLYVHAPARNISVARNACLDAADADWIAFIDDDEIADPDWLRSLIAARGERQVVFGMSQALYSDHRIPAWVRRGDFHSNRIAGNDAAHNGYTANVLMDRGFAARHGIRFDPELGQVGGEDTLFFFQLHRAGATFGYAPSAIVTEETAPSRANFGWLARRRYRSGQVHWLLLRRYQGRGRPSAALESLGKAGYCLVAGLACLPRPERAVAHWLRGLLWVGVLASASGAGFYREYDGGNEGAIRNP